MLRDTTTVYLPVVAVPDRRNWHRFTAVAVITFGHWIINSI